MPYVKDDYYDLQDDEECQLIFSTNGGAVSDWEMNVRNHGALIYIPYYARDFQDLKVHSCFFMNAPEIQRALEKAETPYYIFLENQRLLSQYIDDLLTKSNSHFINPEYQVQNIRSYLHHEYNKRRLQKRKAKKNRHLTNAITGLQWWFNRQEYEPYFKHYAKNHILSYLFFFDGGNNDPPETEMFGVKPSKPN